MMLENIWDPALDLGRLLQLLDSPAPKADDTMTRLVNWWASAAHCGPNTDFLPEIHGQ